MASSSSLAYSRLLSARSTVEPIDPSEVPLWVKEIFIEQCFQVAISGLLVYDARRYFIAQVLINTNFRQVITLEEEVRLVFSSHLKRK